MKTPPLLKFKIKKQKWQSIDSYTYLDYYSIEFFILIIIIIYYDNAHFNFKFDNTFILMIILNYSLLNIKTFNS